MSNTKQLFDELKELANNLETAHDKSQEASEEAANYGGQWEQETATDLDGITVRIREILNDLEEITRDARTFRDDAIVEERQIRASMEDEEISKESVEDVQDTIREKEWKKGQI